MEINQHKKPDIREKTLEHGLAYPLDEELVMLIIGRGTKEMPVAKMAEKIVETLDASNEDNLVENLLKMKGVGHGKALAVAAALELGKRRSNHLRAHIKKATDILPFVKNYAISRREHFLAVTLSGSHEIIQIHVVSVGTLNKTLIHPREVFTDAIKENAAALIVCHNHPSGSCTPSIEDIEATKILLEASGIIGINLLDHIIIDCEGYYSFAEHELVFKRNEDGEEVSEDDGMEAGVVRKAAQGVG